MVPLGILGDFMKNVVAAFCMVAFFVACGDEGSSTESSQENEPVAFEYGRGENAELQDGFQIVHPCKMRQEAQFIFADKLPDGVIPFLWFCVVDKRQICVHFPA